MGGGALIQLVAFGAQNIFLSGDPQITYFKNVYRRYTNFAMESIQQDINGSLNPGSRVSVTISRNGDLLKGLLMQYNPSEIIPETDSDLISCVSTNLGHALINTIEFEIGGQLIDRQYGKWLTIWRDLTLLNLSPYQVLVTRTGAEPSYAATLYNRTAYTHFQFIDDEGAKLGVNTSDAPNEAYVPLQFWFCKNPGLAIPLISLQYHEVKLHILLNPTEYLCATFTESNISKIKPNLNSVKIFADYIYLDSTERKKFANDTHEYLIEQLQLQTYEDNIVSNNTVTIDLTFQQPVKELIFSGKPSDKPFINYISPAPGVFRPAGVNPGPAFPQAILYKDNAASLAEVVDITNVTMTLTFNQAPRFSPRNLKYFTREQIWDCHSGGGSLVISDSIGVYSFALRPEEHQPSGSCNFSRVSNPRMVFTGFDQASTERLFPIGLDIYAISYNVFRIQSGMGSIVFAS